MILRQLQPDEPLYRAIHWGVGQGLLECQLCGALVFPDPDADVDLHTDWHSDIEDLAGRSIRRPTAREVADQWVHADLHGGAANPRSEPPSTLPQYDGTSDGD